MAENDHLLEFIKPASISEADLDQAAALYHDYENWAKEGREKSAGSDAEAGFLRPRKV